MVREDCADQALGHPNLLPPVPQYGFVALMCMSVHFSIFALDGG